VISSSSSSSSSPSSSSPSSSSTTSSSNTATTATTTTSSTSSSPTSFETIIFLRVLYLFSGHQDYWNDKTIEMLPLPQLVKCSLERAASLTDTFQRSRLVHLVLSGGTCALPGLDARLEKVWRGGIST
jgi:actin-related protein